MQLYGKVWFDFTNPQVWHFYQFVRAFAKAGNSVALDWVPFFDGSEAEAMSTYVGLTSPQERGLYLHAMLGLVHIERLDPNETDTVTRAMTAAGLSGESGDIDSTALEDLATAAREIGVAATPTFYQHGPVVHVVLNAAAASSGHLELTAQSIMAVLSDDGIWSLSKP